MTRILVPTDFSENAMNALIYALQLFGHDNAEYTLLNCYTFPSMNMDHIPTISTTIESESKDGLDKVESFIHDKFNKSPYSLHKISRYGALPVVIDNLATEQHFDYVVMGTKGKTSSNNWFMGSVSKSVIQSSPYPVFLIPSNASYRGISEVVFAADLEHKEKQILKRTTDFSKAVDAHVTVLHVDTDVSSKNWSIEELQEMIFETGYDKISSKELVNNNEENAILTYAQADEADLLVLTTYTTTILQRLLHKSVTKQILLNTEIPLLIFNKREYSNIFLA